MTPQENTPVQAGKIRESAAPDSRDETTLRPIRILYWTREGFPINRVDVDVLFGREMLGRGHEIDIVIQSGSSRIAAGRHDWYSRSAFVGPTSEGNILSPFLRHFLALWHDIRMLRLARPEHYDAIQFRDKFLIAAIGQIVARRRGLKFFYWLSFPYPDSDRARARSGDTRFPMFAYVRGLTSGWLLYRWILRRADHTFLQSEQMKKDFVARGFDVNRLTAVPMGIDLRDVSVAPRSQGASGGRIMIGYLGALDKDRHLEILLEMLRLLQRAGVQVHLLLIGDAQQPADREFLQKRAQELGVADLMEITGFLPRLQALQRMQTTDIALSPIYPSEMFRVASPTKLVEYMALGIPVIANHHPEQKLILQRSRAGICAPWSARQFARCVRWLAGLTSEERAEMGRRGREWVNANRSYRRIADDLENKYVELLASPKAAG